MDSQRTILGVSVSLSETEVHWREFLASLQERGLHGVRLVVSDDHKGLEAARQARFPGVSGGQRLDQFAGHLLSIEG
jgi:transposase-like protein